MEKIATDCAVKIISCKTEEELGRVREHVQALFIKHPELKKEWGEWLRDIRDSRLIDLKTPVTDISEHLNEKGKKWLNS